MSARTHQLTRSFYEWERRGRGWEVYPYPVSLEPPFRYPEWQRAPTPSVDDARRDTLRSWVRGLFVRQHDSGRALEIEERLALPRQATDPPDHTEFSLLVPPETSVSLEASEAWLQSLSTLSAPVASELLGFGGRVEQRLACSPSDARLLGVSLHGVEPRAVLAPPVRSLRGLMHGTNGAHAAALECGLGREFMIPLLKPHSRAFDPLSSLVAALADLASDEFALVQTLWQPARAAWVSAITQAVTTPLGKPFFADAPEITKLASEKTSSPLFAVCLRVLARAGDPERAFDIVRGILGALGRLGSPDRNVLIPLATEDPSELVGDVLARRSRRLGMLLSAHELAPLITLPGEASSTSPLARLAPGKSAPERLTEARESVMLGENSTGGENLTVRLPISERLRHTHIIGASGTGKSTLLARLILEDIEAGRGVALLDPHGDLVDEVLGRISNERTGDVVMLDPSDPEAVIGWNILEARSETEKQVLASDLVDVFRRLSTSWGDQMTAILSNAILTFLDSPRGGTLRDLRRFLVEKPYRDEYLRTLQDPQIQGFWTTEYPLLAKRQPHGPILTRLDTLLRHRLVRDVVTARERSLDFRALMDERRVLLVRLAQGAIGRENASLVGALLVSRLYQTALSRQDAAERTPFFLYLDEVHEFATPSLTSIFSGARKFGLGVTVAHQDLYQLHAEHPEVERAILGNAHTRIVFRVGGDDARRLASDLSGFTSDDLVRLRNWQAVARVGSALDDFSLTTLPLPHLDEYTAAARRARLIEESRARWGSPRPLAEAEGAQPPEPKTPSWSELPPDRRARREIPQAPEAPSVSAPVAPPPSPARRTTASKGEGRGGSEHQYLQSLIREWAQARGFRVEVERELPGGGRVDLVLTKGEERTACEISVTTGAEHELENVRKCLADGFSRVFVVSLKRRFLENLSKRLDKELPAEERTRVMVATPEELLAWLANEPAEVSTVAGYTVRTRYRSTDASDQSERHRTLTGVISKSLSRLRRDDP